MCLHGSQIGDRIDRVNGKDVLDGEDCVVKVGLYDPSSPEQPSVLSVCGLPCSVSNCLCLVAFLSTRAWPSVCVYRS